MPSKYRQLILFHAENPRHTISDIHKKGSIKGRTFDIGTVPQKIMKIPVFGNLAYGLQVIQVKHMLDDHCTDQHSGVQDRPSGGFSGITFIKQTYQLVTGNLRTEYNPSVTRIQTVIEGSFKSGERELSLAGIFAAWCTPFGSLLHSLLHLSSLKFQK
jgi:hypothetical protein